MSTQNYKKSIPFVLVVMNNFEQVTNLKEQLVNVINNLTIILNNAENFSAIEKDILLQNLRDAYLAVLKMETAENAPRSCEECQPEKEIAKAEPEPIKEETTPEPEPAPATPETEPEPQAVEPAPQEQPAPKEEPAPQEPVRPEVTKMLNEEEDILDFLSTKISDNSEEDEAFEASLEAQSDPFARIVTIEKNDEPVSIHPAQPKLEPEPAPKAKEEPKTVHIHPQTAESAPSQPAQKRSLNDLLTQQMEDNSLGTKFQHAKVEDLTKAISLNDKFLFIRELFNNKGEEFSTAIQKLNRCTDIDEAFQEIDNLKRYYLWDTTTAAFLSLCDLVRRKFL